MGVVPRGGGDLASFQEHFGRETGFGESVRNGGACGGGLKDV